MKNSGKYVDPVPGNAHIWVPPSSSCDLIANALCSRSVSHCWPLPSVLCTRKEQVGSWGIPLVLNKRWSASSGGIFCLLPKFHQQNRGLLIYFLLVAFSVIKINECLQLDKSSVHASQNQSPSRKFTSYWITRLIIAAHPHQMWPKWKKKSKNQSFMHTSDINLLSTGGGI